jgi:membrane-bound serine protease (ClpP class)
MRICLVLSLALTVLGFFPQESQARDYLIREISLLRIQSAITPVTLDYLRHQFSKAPQDSLLLIEMNTPGGLVSTTQEIITLIGSEERPVAVWVTPEGATAASAGSIIASSAHLIFMSPGTHMGAATPVGLGGDLKASDGRNKLINDLTASVRSISHLRGRPAGPFEDMIRDAKSFTDQEALRLRIIDGVISNASELKTQLHGKTLRIKGEDIKLMVDPQVMTQEYEPTIGQTILGVLSNPSTAYILFLVGLALIYFEFQAPGGYVAGAAGAVLVVISGISFQVLPLHWGAFGLMGLGVALFIIEIFVVSYGLLSVAGAVAFILGSLFLFKGETGLITVPYAAIVSTIAGVFTAVGIIVWYLYREQKRHKPASFFSPLGATGVVLSKVDERTYQVRVRGELWNAQSTDHLIPQDQVKVTEADLQNLLIHVIKI